MIDIKPYNKNAKKHPDKQLKQIAKSIKEFGWQQPIVVDKDRVIIVGHGRWFAWQKFGKEMGLDEPVIKIADLTKEQAKAYRLVDNKLNESPWDLEFAKAELKELDDVLIDIAFDKFDLEEIFKDDIMHQLGKDIDRFHSTKDPGWEESSNPDGIRELVGYDLLSAWGVLEDVNTETGKYFIPLPLNPNDKSRNRIRYSRTHPNELEKIVRTYMREGDYFLESCVGWASFSSVAKFYGFSGVGIDIWDTSLEYCRKQLDAMPGKGKVDIQKMDALDLKFSDNTFDIIYSNPPFFNLEGYKKTKDDISVNDTYDEWVGKMKKLSSECFRVLKPNGLAIFTMADFRKDGILIDAHNDWCRVSKEIGFKLWDHAIQRIKSMSIVTRKRNYKKRYCVKAIEHILIFKKHSAL